MNINWTIVGQMISFAIFVWFCMKYVWPPLMQAIEERQQKISDGLNAAEKAKADLAGAQQEAEAELTAAKAKAAQLIEQANKSASQIVEDARTQATQEGERIKLQAQEAVNQEIVQARETLREQVAALATEGAEKIIRQDVNKDVHSAMLKELAAKL